MKNVDIFILNTYLNHFISNYYKKYLLFKYNT